MSDRQTLLIGEYERLAATHRMLVDVRFKLLAFVPTVTGVGVAFLKDASASRLSVGIFGLLVTVGVILYEVRNSQIHDAAVHMQRSLAGHLGLPNDYGHPPRRKLFGIFQVWHDRALGIVYGTCAGAWAALVAYSGYEWVREGHEWTAGLVGLALGWGAYWQIIRINNATRTYLGRNVPRQAQDCGALHVTVTRGVR
jgi:hypothetical protein